MTGIESFSMLIKVAVLGIILACNKQSPAKAGNINITIAPASGVIDTGLKHYLALGDSYTIGESVPLSDRYPVIVTEMLRAMGLSLADPEIIARTGWTAGELQSAITATKFAYTYDVVTLLIGVNNQYRGGSLNLYRQEFEQNLKNAIVLAGGKTNHVVVLSIPDYGTTPFGQRGDPERIAKEIDQYNTVNKEVSEALKVNYLDITADSKKALTDASLVAADSLHFSGRMYRLWAEQLAPMIKSNLD
ncbi:SGNH/GDSL hydrolase family protein [Flavitalea sp.]|nr:SGNH/GDSL hydrolase family protein [Flavitalea sp.]